MLPSNVLYKLSVASQLASAQMKRRLSVTNLSLENNLPNNVSTECSSCRRK